MWWYTSIILVFVRQRNVIEDSPGYRVRFCLRKTKAKVSGRISALRRQRQVGL